jgi:uncharacterized protein (TIGR03435 family)
MRLLLFLLLLAATAHAQHDFQVATIKPSAPDTPKVMQIRGNRFATEGATVVDLLVYAYNVHPSQIVGGPDWLSTARFDLVADPETEKRPSSDEMKAMVGRLVADRFHLVLKHEKRVLPAYAIVRISKEIRFTRNDSDPQGIPAGGNGTLANFAAFLQRFAATEVNRPVVDQTGISGHFDFDLHYTPAAATEPEPGSPPGLFTAIQEQLGLKLEPVRAAVDVLQVESVSQPTPD